MKRASIISNARRIAYLLIIACLVASCIVMQKSPRAIAVEAAASPQGTIIFLRDGDIWQYELSADVETRLVHDGSCMDPDLHPSGDRIVYTSNRDGFNEPVTGRPGGQVYQYDMVTRTSTRLVTLPDYNCYDPSYSPDGKKVVFAREKPSGEAGIETAELCVLNMATGSLQVIDESTNGWEWITYVNPTFKPGGSEIVFISMGEGASSAGVIPATGGDIDWIDLSTDLGVPYPNIFAAVFSPDNQKMVVSASTDYTEPTGIYIKNPLSANAVWIFDEEDIGDPYSFSPGSNYIVYGWQWWSDNPSVYISNLDGSYKKRVVYNGADPDWGPAFTFTFTPTTTSYFAEGYTGVGFQEYLCLGNPTASEAITRITYYIQDGGTQQSYYRIPARSRLTVDVNNQVGAGKSVSAKVESDQKIVAERPMYFNYAGWDGGHDVMGAPAPARTFYFAEGYTGPGFDEYICVMNPRAERAALTFRFQTQEGEEKVVTGRGVPARSRATFLVNDLLGGAYSASLKLTSSVPVVAERPMYFSYGAGWTGGHCVMGATSLAKSYFFAEGATHAGFQEYLTLQNPNAARISVHATYMLAGGKTTEKDYPVPAKRRATVYVPNEVGEGRDVSVRLTCSSPFLAERPTYFSYGGGWTGGHCVIGATASARTWFFAEGYTGAGFDEWLCIQNPGASPAHVTITYYPEGGAPIKRTQPPIAARSRYTVYVNAPEQAGPGLSISAKVTSDVPIICERPMYFNFSGWTGGHDVVGSVP